MKRVSFIMLLLLLVMLVFSGCSRENVDTSKLNIVTSFYPMYIATANIVDGVEDVTLQNLTATTTGCLHDYQLTTANMITLSSADILVVNGEGMETFIDKALNACENLNVIDASEGILEQHEKKQHDENDLHESASGGAATAMLRELLQNGGVVYGCSGEDIFNVHHIRVNHYADVEKLRGSQYVQSNIGYIYKKVKVD